jgi:hypothetical protein
MTSVEKHKTGFSNVGILPYENLKEMDSENVDNGTW